MKNWLRVTICVMLIVSVLTMSLSVFATDGVDVIQAKETLVAYYIWEFLRAIGIDVTFRDVLEYNDYIQDTIIEWVTDYIGDLIEADSLPSSYTISQWIAPWTIGYDYWGNLQYNSTMLEDLQDFADWLKSEFSLLDDDTIVINPVYSVNGYQLFLINEYYAGHYQQQPPSGHVYDYVAVGAFTTGDSNTYVDNPYVIGWFPYYIRQGSGYNYEVIAVKSRNAGQARVAWKFVHRNNSEATSVTQTWTTPNWVQSVNGYYSHNYDIGKFTISNDPFGEFIVTENCPYFESVSERTAFMQNLDVVQDGDIKIVTGTINLPVDNPNYTEGDSMTIIDGQPDYTVIEWPDSMAINNLPAIVSTTAIQNPHLEEAYRPIQGLITYAKDGVGICMALLYELPDEMVYMWYGLIASIVVWGMIKLMREH